MSGKLVGLAMERRVGSPTAKLVLVKLADQANDDGISWPSVKTICKHTELSERAVQEQIRKLEKMGLLRIVPRRREDGKSTSNVYQLLLALPEVARVQEAHPPQEVRGEGAGGAGGRVQEVHPEPLLVNPHLNNTPATPVAVDGVTPPKPKRPKPKPALKETPEFVEWYDAYPKKIDRGDALKAYLEVTKTGAAPADLLAGAKRYALERQNEERRYTKGPAAWLRAKKWLDEPTLLAAAIPSAGPSPDDWDGIVARWFGVGVPTAETYWPKDAGPRPGKPGCKAPIELLKKYEDKAKRAAA